MCPVKPGIGSCFTYRAVGKRRGYPARSNNTNNQNPTQALVKQQLTEQWNQDIWSEYKKTKLPYFKSVKR